MKTSSGIKQPTMFDTSVDIFKSGIVKEVNVDKIARMKSLGLHMELFNQQDSYNIPLSSDDFDCEACAVLGQRGQGKSNTVNRIVEQLIPKGFGMTIFDIEGEYFSLKSNYCVVVVGSGAGKYYDLQLDHVKAPVLAEMAVMQKLVVVLDFSDVEEDVRVKFSLDYLQAVLSLCNVLKNEGKPTQHILVIEEVQEYAPEDGPAHFGDKQHNMLMNLKKEIKRIATRGRKRGIGMIIASQRTAQVDKTLLSQCETKVLHKVTLPNDVSVYDRIMGGIYDSKTLRENIQKMVPGDCFAYFGDEWHTAHVLPQDTLHLGYSPKLSFAVEDVPDLKEVDKKILQDIMTGSSIYAKKIQSPYQKVLDDLKQEVFDKERLIENLRSELAISQKELKYSQRLSVEISPESLAKAMLAVTSLTKGEVPEQKTIKAMAEHIKSQLADTPDDVGDADDAEYEESTDTLSLVGV